MTESSKNKHPLDLAKEIQEGLLKEHQLPCSIGIAPTLFLAKMASDMKKPLGITVIRKKDIVDKLFPLPIKEMFGIGKKTYPKLENLGIHTIGDFTKKEFKSNILTIMSEQSYEAYLDHIMGRSSDIIDPKKYQIPQSVSNETTLNYPMDQYDAILEILKDLLEQTHERLIKEELVAKTLGLNLEHQTLKPLVGEGSHSVNTQMIIGYFLEKMENLFETNFQGQTIRLVGIYLNQVIQKKDLKIDFNLFNYQEFTKREEALYHKKKVTLQNVT